MILGSLYDTSLHIKYFIGKQLFILCMDSISMESFYFPSIGWFDKIILPLGCIRYFCPRVVFPSLNPFMSNSIFFYSSKFNPKAILLSLLTNVEIEVGK
jgi:hypothetical protein